MILTELERQERGKMKVATKQRLIFGDPDVLAWMKLCERTARRGAVATVTRAPLVATVGSSRAFPNKGTEITYLRNMPLIKTIRGLLVEAIKREFPDGGGGHFCTILLKDDSLVNFWVPFGNLDEHTAPVHTVDKFDETLAKDWKLVSKVWNGKTKMSLVE